VDPFAPTADPAAYIPREATERALAQLEHAFRHGQRVQVLSGPPGTGKTLLVHVLAERLAGDFRTLYLPYASLAFGELCGWILGLLGEPVGHFPDRELLASARASDALGRPLLLLVDEASSIPPEAAEGLAGLVREADGALRLLLVPVDEARAGRVLAVLARDVAELRVSAPLALEEAEHCVRTRLVRAAAPFELQRRFDAGLVKRLHRASAGNPQRLMQLAGEVLRGNLAALPGHEAEAELDAPGRDSTPAIEIDALEALETRPAPAAPAPPRPPGPPAAPGAAPPGLAPERSVRPPPGDRMGSAGPALARAPEEAPSGPAEPAGTNWLVVVAVNFALLAGALLGLWASGFLPPPG
jgi:type II secretory pathway predicted ATPase ExeA